MSKKKEEAEKETEGEALANSTSLSFLIVGTYALETLADAVSFNKFLKEKSIRKKPLLHGMKLVFENLIEDQINQIQTNAGFTLSTDRITERALSKGIPIEEARSNSSIAKILRGLKKAIEEVCKETSVPDFHVTLSEQLSPLFEAVKELFDKYTVIMSKECKDLDKEVALNLFAFSWYLRFLNIRQQVRVPLIERTLEDLTRLTGGFEEVPKGEISPAYKKHLEKQEKERKKKRKKFEKSFQGWKTCAAFLWSKLEGSLLPKAPVDSILNCASWEELDDLFRPTADNLIAEVDKRLGTTMGSVFSRVSECTPKSLDTLMIEYDSAKKADDKLSLDHSFLWHDFEILDGAHPKIFPGVATFTNLLVGTVYMKRYYGRTNPVAIRRILHPAGFHLFKRNGVEQKREKFDISYAILVPSFSTVADYSGWLVSLHCCNDYSGFAGGMRKYAEHFIEQNKESLSIEDIVVPLDDFRQYLKSKLHDRHKRSFSRLSESEWESITLEESIELGTDMSAVIIELFMAVLMAEAGYDVHWRYRNNDVIGRKEIDVLAVGKKDVQIIECSRHLPKNSAGITERVHEMKRKSKLIENSEFRRKRIILRYITSKNLENEGFSQAAEVFRKEGISTENIYRLLKNSQHREEPLQELLSEIDFLRTRSERH